MFDSFVPEAYKQKTWVQNIAKSSDPRIEFFKQWEHRESLIGKQQAINIPGDDATPEQVKEFHKLLGVPDDVAEYKYEGLKYEDTNPDKPLAEALMNSRPGDFVSSIAAEAQKLGITPKQFAALAQAYDTKYIEANKTALSKYQEMQRSVDLDLEKQLDSIYGTRKAQVVARVTAELDSLGPEFQVARNRLDNNSLIALAGIVDKNLTKYAREDTFNQQHVSSGVPTSEGLRAERLQIMQSKEYSDIRSAGHAAAKGRVNALNEQMRQLLKT